MPTRSIPNEEWSTFLDSFSTQFATRSVAVRFSDPELGYQLEMIRVPLIGVTFIAGREEGPGSR